MPTAPAWQMGTTWQERQAAGPNWQQELRPVRSAIAARGRAPTPSFGPPQQFPGGLGDGGPAQWQPNDGPTSLEDLASNWNNSPTFSPPGLNGFGPPGQGGGTPGGFGMGGGNQGIPPGLEERMQKLGLGGPGNSQGRSRLASITGGGASGGFGGFRRTAASTRFSGGMRPRRKRMEY